MQLLAPARDRNITRQAGDLGVRRRARPFDDVVGHDRLVAYAFDRRVDLGLEIAAAYVDPANPFGIGGHHVWIGCAATVLGSLERETAAKGVVAYRLISWEPDRAEQPLAGSMHGVMARHRGKRQEHD